MKWQWKYTTCRCSTHKAQVQTEVFYLNQRLEMLLCCCCRLHWRPRARRCSDGRTPTWRSRWWCWRSRTRRAHDCRSLSPCRTWREGSVPRLVSRGWCRRTPLQSSWSEDMELLKNKACFRCLFFSAQCKKKKITFLSIFFVARSVVMNYTVSSNIKLSYSMLRFFSCTSSFASIIAVTTTNTVG